jgi:hypothetical protein
MLKGSKKAAKTAKNAERAAPEGCFNRDHCVCGGKRTFDVANGTATASSNARGYRGSQAIPLLDQASHKICTVCIATMQKHKLHGDEAATFEASGDGGELTRAQTSFAQFPCAYGEPPCALCANAVRATQSLMFEVSPWRRSQRILSLPCI